jgi:nucleoside-diphosphate-sugar epimerase
VQGTISLAKTLPDWRWSEKVPLEEGIRRTVESYRQAEMGDTYTHLRIANE